MGELSGSLFVMFEAIWDQFLRVVLYVADPNQRIFSLYLLTSILFAALVFVHTSRKEGFAEQGFGRGFVNFLFPRSVWSSSSAWLDVRYFFFHQMVRLLIYGFFMTGMIALSASLAGQLWGTLAPGLDFSGQELGWTFALVVTVSLAVAADFMMFLIHYLQHRIPLLWEFHKVHHSATVLQPLTNYREHPIDNIVYAIGHGVVMGIGLGTVFALFGTTPDMTTVYGVSVLAFAYNLLGYNLRHSHIWLRWPGKLVYVFGCPAHHQIHHSYHPQHVDKNFAFMFPVWDVLFGTFELPETNRDVVYGLNGWEEQEYRSCLSLYLVPFRKALARFRRPSGDVSPTSKA